MSFVVNLSFLFLNLLSVNIITVPNSMSATPPAPPALLAAVPGYPPQQGMFTRRDIHLMSHRASRYSATSNVHGLKLAKLL